MRYSLILLLFVFLACQDQGEHDQDIKAIPFQSTVDYTKRLDSLGIELQKPPVPQNNYVNITQAGNLLFLAGKGPKRADGTYIRGKLGKDLSIEEGYEAARLTAISQIGVLKDYLGDLNRVKQIVKVKGMVNAVPEFTDQPKVINGYSDLMVKVFGEKGKHARAAVGMGSLPGNIAVEVDMVVEIY